MAVALKEAWKNLELLAGGPFGAVIVKDGEIISCARNMVLARQDPTMHAEIVAIREACQKLGRIDLSDCVIYTTCEPCPMCLGAICWARIKKIYYGCTRDDAARIGFSDADIYKAIAGNLLLVEIENIEREACLELFKAWGEKTPEAPY